MAKETKEVKEHRVYAYEIIIIILIALILSYVFYVLSISLFDKVERAEEKINTLQTDMAKLHLEIYNLEMKSGNAKESAPKNSTQGALGE